MTWGLSSYETRIRWMAALWAILMTVWCMSPLAWQIRLIGGAIWVAITVLASCCYAWWRPRSARDVPIFLSFGRVSETLSDAVSPKRTLRPKELETLIRNLLSAGYRFQTVREALTAPIRKSVVPVVDGGTRADLSELLPILRRTGAKATCFIAPRDPADVRFLKSLELQELARSGLVEIGASLSEDPLPPPEVRASALERNRNVLTGILGGLPYAFLYPESAREDEALHTLLRELGYHAALFEVRKVHPTVRNPLAIPCRALTRGLLPWQAYLLATRGRWRAF